MLLLFLGLVALSMLVVESLRAPPEPAAQASGDDDVLELRLGRLPPPPAAAPAEPAKPAPAAAPRPAPPPAAAQPAPAASSDLYVVQPGDTLSSIAQKQLGSARLADQLARLNGITDPARLKVG